MSYEPNQPAAESVPCRKPNLGLTAIAFRVLWIVPAVAVLIVVLFLAMGRIELSQTGSHLLAALVYTALIAIPSMFTLTWVGIRYAGRFPRLIIFIYALLLLCTATVGSFAAAFLLELLRIIPHGEFLREFRASYPFSVVITEITGLAIATFESMRHKLQSATIELRTRQVEQERANKLLAEAQLSSLESRIHPHFLFNTLNSIAALIPSDPRRAEDTVAKLASLLRFSLNAPHSRLVPLAQELKIVRDYLEIEATRFGSRLRYQIVVPESLAALRVPPLALQTLVENCVKHVAGQRSEATTIRIATSLKSSRIHLEVADDGPGFSLDAISPEHGLGNLIARLELLFGDAGQLAVTRENNQTVVRMSFPAES